MRKPICPNCKNYGGNYEGGGKWLCYIAHAYGDWMDKNTLNLVGCASFNKPQRYKGERY